ncbi:MAG: putative beta-lysine N-acetyltransferase [Candidatus Marinimicrobia bacterium]|nr:putative beta-lysine N-acetyltransferase [Candidatus Neomarinimicrobiota bacterium]
MSDIILKHGNSLIQHGSLSDRVYIMKLDPGECEEVIDFVEKLATEKGYSKIFAKVPLSLITTFIAGGYEEEARIPELGESPSGIAFMSNFLVKRRKKPGKTHEIMQVKSASLIRGVPRKSTPLSSEFSIKEAEIADSADLALLYREVFASYPFPIYDPLFIANSMTEDVRYFIISHKGEIVAAAAAEMDYDTRSVEMTDFATNPGHRGRQFGQILLDHMEVAMIQEPIDTTYTIARAVSHGMNITFARSDYEFAGTLINNTNISGSIESMNVWYKQIVHPAN